MSLSRSGRIALLLSLAWGLPLAFGETKPREKPADYAVQANVADNLTLTAESLARSIPVSSGVLFAEDHLVIEVAFFGPVGRRPHKFAPEDFVLLINGSKLPLLPDSPGSVAMSMRDSVFHTRPTLQASGSINNAGVLIGGRRPTIGAPDIDQRSRGPVPPRVPESTDRSGGVSTRETLDVPKAIEEAALLTCECKTPVAGLVFFPYRGKLKSIRKMVLRYTPQPGTTSVDLNLLP
jgi:hypothetical protein